MVTVPQSKDISVSTVSHIKVSAMFSVIQVTRDQYNILCLVLLNPSMCCKNSTAPVSRLDFILAHDCSIFRKIYL